MDTLHREAQGRGQEPTRKGSVDEVDTATHCSVDEVGTATHCNTLQHTATHCNTLQQSATHCNALQHTATLCNTLQHSATHSVDEVETGNVDEPTGTDLSMNYSEALICR